MKNNNEFTEEIIEEIEIESSQISKEDLNKIVSNEEDISNKTSKLDLNRFTKMINQIKLALSLIRDFRNKRYNEIPWRSITMLVAAVLYFINPFDMVPDILPVFGFTDDALFFAAVFKFIQSDLEVYCNWKGLDIQKYF